MQPLPLLLLSGASKTWLHTDTGDLHYQIYAGTYRFDVNGGTTEMPTHDATGAVPFHWQPTANVWTYLSVTYSTQNKYIKLWVNSQFVETIDCQTCTVPVTLDSPRIGSWLDPSSTVGVPAPWSRGEEDEGEMSPERRPS